jgi:hypothetical protein
VNDGRGQPQIRLGNGRKNPDVLHFNTWCFLCLGSSWFKKYQNTQRKVYGVNPRRKLILEISATASRADFFFLVLDNVWITQRIAVVDLFHHINHRL